MQQGLALSPEDALQVKAVRLPSMPCPPPAFCPGCGGTIYVCYKCKAEVPGGGS